LYTLLVICFFGGRAVSWTPVHAALERLQPCPPELLAILARTFGDPARADASTLKRLDQLMNALHTEPAPARVVRVAIAGAYIDRLQSCRAALRHVVDLGREGGAITSAIEALFLLANDAYFTGQWDELELRTTEGLDLCDEYGYRLLKWPGIFLRALLAAARGETAMARDLADDMTRWANPRGAGSVRNYALHVQTLLALGQGEFETAFQHASAISPAGELASHAPHALWVAMDLVEAGIRANREGEAAAHVKALQEAHVAEISPRLEMLTNAAAAITAPDEEKRTRFEDVLRLEQINRWPFEYARIELAYGEYLRRARATGEARTHLTRALEGFRLLRAKPWAAKASGELRAAGAATRRPTATITSEAITPSSSRSRNSRPRA
jgi:hypothetical protein